MRVAIDAEFFRLPPSGIGGYVRNLVSALQGLEVDLDVDVIEPGWDHRGPAERSRSPMRDRRVQRASWELAGFARAAAKRKPDLLHVPSFAAPFLIPCPTVVTIHDVIPFVLPEYRASAAMRLHMRLMRRTVRRAALVIAPSHSAANEIAEVLAIPRDAIRVTHEAADAACQPATDPQAIRATLARFGLDSRYIFNVGGFDVRKNVPLLIEAFANMKASLGEPVKLVIAGAPHSNNPVVFPPVEPVIQRLGLERDVILTGRISEADKIALYQGADLYVTPSSYEGFGLTLLEAMACGVPAIAANRSSFPEIAGDAGLLVELDRDALSSAMANVLSDPGLAQNLRERGLARAAEFSWRRTAELTYAVYEEALWGR